MKARLMKANKLKLLGAKLDQEEWRSVFDAQDIDSKVDNFTLIAIQLLKETLPETTIRVRQIFMLPQMAKVLETEMQLKLSSTDL